MKTAKESFFEAKNQIRDAVDFRISKLEGQLFQLKTYQARFGGLLSWFHPKSTESIARLETQLATYLEIHSFIRNNVLYKNEEPIPVKLPKASGLAELRKKRKVKK